MSHLSSVKNWLAHSTLQSLVSDALVGTGFMVNVVTAALPL